MDLIWTTGPGSVSLEATYPFVSRDGSLRYHAAPNAHLIMTALNLAKRRYPIAILPLLTVILNANVETQQSVIAWAFNALCNAASMHNAFGTVLSVKTTRFKRWAALDETKQRAMLEALRNVKMTAVAPLHQQDDAEFRKRRLARNPGNPQRRPAPPSPVIDPIAKRYSPRLGTSGGHKDRKHPGWRD